MSIITFKYYQYRFLLDLMKAFTTNSCGLCIIVENIYLSAK